MGEGFRKCLLVNGLLNPNDYLFRCRVILVSLEKRKFSLVIGLWPVRNQVAQPGCTAGGEGADQ